MKLKRILASVLSVALLLQLSPLNIWALDEDLQQTPQVSTVQENIDPAPVEGSALLPAHSVPRRCVAQRNNRNDSQRKIGRITAKQSVKARFIWG